MYIYIVLPFLSIYFSRLLKWDNNDNNKNKKRVLFLFKSKKFDIKLDQNFHRWMGQRFFVN